MRPANRAREDIKGYDFYGFAIFNGDGQVDSERYHLYTVRQSYSSEEESAWTRLLADWNVAKSRRTSKLHAYLQRGVPPRLRSLLWQKLLDTETLKGTTQFSYQLHVDGVREQLVDLGISEYGSGNVAAHLSELEADQYRIKFEQISMDALRHILLDLDRTFPTHKMFMGVTAEAREGRAKLFRVLAVYARYNKQVEYCQGMSSLAAMLLMQMEEEEAFWCLVSLLERHKYLRGYFNHHMSRVQKHAAVFGMLLRNRMPKLHTHIERMGIDPLMYTTPWLMCLFTSLGSWDTVLAIWDLFLLRGFRTMFQVGLAILQLFEAELIRDKDITHVLPKLLRLPFHIVSHKTLMAAVWGITLEDWEVTSLLAILDERSSPCKSGRKRAFADSDVTDDGKENDGVFRFRGKPAAQEESQAKRHRKNEPLVPPADRQPQPSLLRRFVNIFTPNTETGTVPNSRGRSAQLSSMKRSTLERRRSNQRAEAQGTSQSSAAVNIDKQNGRTTGATVWAVPYPGGLGASHPSDLTDEHVSPCAELLDDSAVADGAPRSSTRSQRDFDLVRHSPRLRQQGAPGPFNLPEVRVSLIDSLQTASSRHSFQSFLTQTPRRSPRGKQATPFSPPFMKSPYTEMKEFRQPGKQP